MGGRLSATFAGNDGARTPEPDTTLSTVEFSKHLGKSLWGLADKALPVAYGLGYVYLVIRVLPEEEFGNFVLLQEIFLILSGLATAFALQPLLKYMAEDTGNTGGILAVSVLFNLLFVAVTTAAIVLARAPLAELLNAPSFSPLLLQLPALMAASFIRNLTLVLLQSRFLISRVFWVDALHFLGAPLLVWIYSRLHLFDSAMDLVIINIISLSASSALGLVLTTSLLRGVRKPTSDEMRKVWDYGVYSVGGVVSYLVYTKADTFVLSAFTGPFHVAVYTSAKVFTRVFDMMSQIVQIFVFPAASRLWARGEIREVKAVVEKATNFLTLGMVPVLLLFIAFAPLLVTILYQGKYDEAIPLLQVFAVLAVILPVAEVARNTLMGLGHVQKAFYISVQALVVSLVCYFALIPFFGPMGAAVAFVLGGMTLAWLSWHALTREIPIRVSEVLARTNDAWRFVKRYLRS